MKLPFLLYTFILFTNYEITINWRRLLYVYKATNAVGKWLRECIYSSTQVIYSILTAYKAHRINIFNLNIQSEWGKISISYMMSAPPPPPPPFRCILKAQLIAICLCNATLEDTYDITPLSRLPLNWNNF